MITQIYFLIDHRNTNCSFLCFNVYPTLFSYKSLVWVFFSFKSLCLVIFFWIEKLILVFKCLSTLILWLVIINERLIFSLVEMIINVYFLEKLNINLVFVLNEHWSWFSYQSNGQNLFNKSLTKNYIVSHLPSESEMRPVRKKHEPITSLVPINTIRRWVRILFNVQAIPLVGFLLQ
jgi:hypothetical protein